MQAERWRVDPHATRDVTRRTRDEAETLGDALRSIGQAMDEACGVLGATDSHDALDGLREDPFAIEVRSVREHVENAANEVDASVDAFDDGDDTMRTEIERQAQILQSRRNQVQVR